MVEGSYPLNHFLSQLPDVTFVKLLGRIDLRRIGFIFMLSGINQTISPNLKRVQDLVVLRRQLEQMTEGNGFNLNNSFVQRRIQIIEAQINAIESTFR